MSKLRKLISLVLTVCMLASIVSVAAVTASANAGDAKHRQLITGVVNSEPTTELITEPIETGPEDNDIVYNRDKCIYFDSSDWENVTQVNCIILQRSEEDSDSWQSNYEKCESVGEDMWAYDCSRIPLEPDGDYLIILISNTERRTHECTFGTECYGDTLKLTGNIIEEPVDPVKKSDEAVWEYNYDLYGPHKGITNSGEVVGSFLCPHETKAEIIGPWVYVFGESQYVKNPVKTLANVYKNFGIECLEDIYDIYYYMAYECDDYDRIYEDELNRIKELLLKAINPSIGFKKGNYVYKTISDYEVSLWEYFDYDEEDDDYSICVNIPSFVEYEDKTYKINEIGKGAFYSCDNLKEISLGTGIISIGDNAFYGCDSLTNINIPNSVTTIGDYAFEDCESIKSVVIPKSVKRIGKYAFGSYDYVHGIDDIINDFIIYGYKGSEAEKYAVKYDITFLALDNEDTIPTELNSTKPIVTDPITTEPIVTEPVVTEPIVTNPVVTNPVSTEPFVTEPITPPVVTDPITTEPNATNPEVTDPIDTEPITPPVVTDPESQEPVQPTNGTYEETKIDISSWQVIGLSNKTYTGKPIQQALAVTNGREFASFDAAYQNNINAGTAIVLIKGKGNYTGSILKTFKINKANQSFTVSAKSKTIKAKKLKKKAQTVKAITVKDNQGKVTYKLVKSGITKKIRKLVKINSKGVITIKKWKKAKKGTYKIKVTVKAAGNTNYNAKTITKTVKVKVK